MEPKVPADRSIREQHTLQDLNGRRSRKPLLGMVAKDGSPGWYFRNV